MKFPIIGITLRSTFIFFSLTLLFSCHFNATYNNRVEDKDDAQKVTNAFYHLLRNGEYNDTYILFSKKFFQLTDTSKLGNLYQITYNKLGAIDYINLDHWQTQVVKGNNPI